MDAAESRARAARLWVAALVVLGVSGVAYQGWREAQRMKPVISGAPAADFHLPRADGKGVVALSDLRGKVVMLDFWATWCPPCVEEMPLLIRVAKEYEGRGLVLVAANRDDTQTAEQDVKMFIAKVAPELVRYAAYADEETASRYRLRVLPTLYFIGRDGEVLGTQLGQVSERDLRGWIESALSGKRVGPVPGQGSATQGRSARPN